MEAGQCRASRLCHVKVRVHFLGEGGLNVSLGVIFFFGGGYMLSWRMWAQLDYSGEPDETQECG